MSDRRRTFARLAYWSAALGVATGVSHDLAPDHRLLSARLALRRRGAIERDPGFGASHGAQGRGGERHRRPREADARDRRYALLLLRARLPGVRDSGLPDGAPRAERLH